MSRPTLIAATSLLFLCSSAQGQVSLFEHSDFRGLSRTYDYEVRDLKRSDFPNDAASSVVVAPGCTAWLYSDRDFQGRETVIDGRGRHSRRHAESIADLSYTRVGNDHLSSLVVRCDRYRGHRDNSYQESRRGRRSVNPERSYGGGRRGDRGYGDGRYGKRAAAVLFSDAGFRGRSLAIDHQLRDLTHTPIGNDRLSSIEVAPGCRAIVFEHIDFRGRSTVLRHGAASLDRTAVGNDRASSIVVECR